MDYCRHEDCPFTDCEYHQDHVPFGVPYDVRPMDESCERLSAHMKERAELREKIQRMTFRDAFFIFRKIDDPDLADELKGAAIKKILSLETHNGVTKADMLKVIRYLFDLCFEETEG